MNINFNNLFNQFAIFLSVVLFAFILDTALFVYLPKTQPTFQKENSETLDYKRYDIIRAFKNTTKKIQQPKKKIIKKQYNLNDNIILKAIYAKDNQRGFIIIQEKHKSDTQMLGINDSIKGYILKQIYATYVIFNKNNKEYRLNLNDNKKTKNFTTTPVIQKEQPKPENDSNIVVLDDKISVQRAYLNSYINNIDKIWKNINIQEVKTPHGIDGFKVRYIKPGSVFSALGLQKGDIIKSVNNIKLKSYNDAFKVYRKINDITNINMQIQRGNQTMELNYEIQ